MLEEKVDLPAVQQPRGRIKVEITDADSGEVLQKAENDNFISKGMQHLYEAQMKNLFLNGLFKINNPLRYMVLTDADHDADPENEWVVRGKVIGQAYTDTNTLLGGTTGGQLNDVESFTDQNHRRIVVDFPASSANGTISSVYFHPNNFAHVGDVAANVKEFAKKSIDGIGFKRYKNRIYSVSYLTTGVGTRYTRLYVYDLDYNLIKQRNLVEDSPSYNSMHYRNITSMTIYNDRMYFVGDKNYNGTTLIFSIPMSVIESSDNTEVLNRTELEDVVEHASMDGYRINTGIEYNPDARVFYVVVSGRVDIYDTDFNIQHSIAISGGMPISRFVTYHEGVLYWDGGTIDLDKGLWTKLGATMSVRGFTDEGYVITGARTGNNYYNNCFIMHKFGFTSRAKLSTPVTKTTANNMKVTYDFILPSMFPEENDF